MRDRFEFTLHSPLTKEDWNKLSDAEHEKETDRDDHADDYCDGYYDGMRKALAIIDKNRTESEEKDDRFCGADMRKKDDEG